MEKVRKSAKNTLKKILPPFAIDAVKALTHAQLWRGRYSSWEAALKDSAGYNQANILEKVIQAQMAVKNGEYAFERDSVVFSEPEVDFPAVSAFLYAREIENLSVVDFGGSLGSFYFQHRKILEKFKSVTWTVLEQPHFVDAGKREFESESLKFEMAMKDAVKKYQPQVLYSSGCFQYLPEPHRQIEELVEFGLKYIVLNRIGFNAESKDRLTVQQVPEETYKASYPCWFFEEKAFLKHFEKDYELIWDFHCKDQADIPSYYKGFFFRKK